MADVVRLSFHSLRFSSSLLTSFASSLNSLRPGLLSIQNSDKRGYPLLYSSAGDLARFDFRPRKQQVSFKVHATVADTDQPKWWEKNAPNMVDIHSTQELLSALSQAGDRLVIVEFYGTWCASCRALFPKVLPYFHFYRGADGQLESFSCSLAKFQKIKDAIITHNTDRCSIGPPKGVGDLRLEPSLAPKDRAAESTSA
ncbi:hypothetical protein I3760_04G148000 [Carya illinoinensis]|nr:hypothetical protein I3760_04G148000 [Carya illinoinensis]